MVRQFAKRTRWMTRLATDQLGDWLYSIDTVEAGPLPLAKERSRFGDAYVNGPVSYWILHSYLNCAKFPGDDIFYDIGCGHGRVLCMVARQRITKCVGIELSDSFAAKARANAKSLRGRLAPIEVRVGDAAEMDYNDGTRFYFGDPFGAGTMLAVLNRIYGTLKKSPRSIQCIFILPILERSNAIRQAIAASGWLHYVGHKHLPFALLRAEYWAYDFDSTRGNATLPFSMANTNAPVGRVAA